MPLAFIARSDEDSTVGGLWGDIWEEGTTSLSAALRMYMADLVLLITAGMPFASTHPSVVQPKDQAGTGSKCNFDTLLAIDDFMESKHGHILHLK